MEHGNVGRPIQSAAHAFTSQIMNRHSGTLIASEFKWELRKRPCPARPIKEARS